MRKQRQEGGLNPLVLVGMNHGKTFYGVDENEQKSPGRGRELNLHRSMI